MGASEFCITKVEVLNQQILPSHLGMNPELVLTAPQKTVRFRKRLKRVSEYQRGEEDKTSNIPLPNVVLGDNVQEGLGKFLFPKYRMVINHGVQIRFYVYNVHVYLISYYIF